MSRFTEAQGIASESLMEQLAEPIEYWPLGVEEDAIDIDAIFTPYTTREAPGERRTAQTRRAELQIWADVERGVVSPELKSDVAIINGVHWLVSEELETSGTMHRLMVERVARCVVGRARGVR